MLKPCVVISFDDLSQNLRQTAIRGVFAFLFGFLWLAESVTGIQLVGSVLVLIGILVAQRATAK